MWISLQELLFNLKEINIKNFSFKKGNFPHLAKCYSLVVLIINIKVIIF